MRPLLVLAVLGLTVYTLIDCARTPADEVRSLPKVLWLLVIALVWVVGPIGWLWLGRERGQGGEPGPRTSGRVAPDDDPDFLRRLDLSLRDPEVRPPDDEAPTR